MVGEGGLSPNEILFGRKRFLPGLLYTPEGICGDASQFFDKMSNIDKTVSLALSKQHLEVSKRRYPPERNTKLVTWFGYSNPKTSLPRVSWKPDGMCPWLSQKDLPPILLWFRTRSTFFSKCTATS
jgi:hypothetical protein